MTEDLLEEVAFRLGFGGCVGFGDAEEAERTAYGKAIALGARVLLKTVPRAIQFNSPRKVSLR